MPANSLCEGSGTGSMTGPPPGTVCYVNGHLYYRAALSWVPVDPRTAERRARSDRHNRGDAAARAAAREDWAAAHPDEEVPPWIGV